MNKSVIWHSFLSFWNLQNGIKARNDFREIILCFDTILQIFHIYVAENYASIGSLDLYIFL